MCLCIKLGPYCHLLQFLKDTVKINSIGHCNFSQSQFLKDLLLKSIMTSGQHIILSLNSHNVFLLFLNRIMGINKSSVKEDFILTGFSDQPSLEKNTLCGNFGILSPDSYGKYNHYSDLLHRF